MLVGELVGQISGNRKWEDNLLLDVVPLECCVSVGVTGVCAIGKFPITKLVKVEEVAEKSVKIFQDAGRKGTCKVSDIASGIIERPTPFGGVALGQDKFDVGVFGVRTEVV